MKGAKINLRKGIQYATLFGFLLLYARTAYHGQDELLWPVHLVFKLDPLALLNTILAGSAPILSLWLGALLLLFSTALLGRFFCGWLCPTGTTLDLVGSLLRKVAGKKRGFQSFRPSQRTALAFLTFLIAATLFGLPLLTFFDPLSILLRSLTIAIFPSFDGVAKSILGGAMSASVPLSDALFEALSGTLLLLETPAFLLVGATALIFGGIALLELVTPRFWCTYLCPLGALLGVFSRLSPLSRRRTDSCSNCKGCASRCPTRAAESDPADKGLCIQCMECGELCDKESDGMRAALAPVALGAPQSSTRRVVLGSLVLGGATALFSGTATQAKMRKATFLRPPGNSDEERFNNLCISCCCINIMMHFRIKLSRSLKA